MVFNSIFENNKKLFQKNIYLKNKNVLLEDQLKKEIGDQNERSFEDN